MYFVLPIGFPWFPLSGIRLCYWLWNVAPLPRWETGDRRSSIHHPHPSSLQLSPSLLNFYPFFVFLCFLFFWSEKINMASCVASIKQSQINTSSAFPGLMQSAEVTESETFVGKLPSDWHSDPAGGEGLTTASDGHDTFSPVLIKIAGLVSPPVLCAVRHTVSRIITLAARSPPDAVSCRLLSVWLMGGWKYSAEPAAKPHSDAVLSVFFIRVGGSRERR